MARQTLATPRCGDADCVQPMNPGSSCSRGDLKPGNDPRRRCTPDGMDHAANWTGRSKEKRFWHMSWNTIKNSSARGNSNKFASDQSRSVYETVDELWRSDFLPVGDEKDDEVLERGCYSLSSDDEEGPGREHLCGQDWNEADDASDVDVERGAALVRDCERPYPRLRTAPRPRLAQAQLQCLGIDLGQ